MRIATSSNADRSRFSASELELARILWAWDPIGVAPLLDDARKDDYDEYDDLVRPIMIELGHGIHWSSLAKKLAQTLDRDYGLVLREQAARDVAVTITEWWAALPALP